MAWYTINYTCGHTERVQLYGAHKDRYAKIEAMERRACPECEAKAAQEQAASDGLPALTGSDKQISWASDIRARWLNCDDTPDNMTLTCKALIKYLVAAISSKTDSNDVALRLMSAALTSLDANPDYTAYNPAEAQAALRARATSHAAAKWWIDNRGRIGRQTAQEIIADIDKETN